MVRKASQPKPDLYLFLSAHNCMLRGTTDQGTEFIATLLAQMAASTDRPVALTYSGFLPVPGSAVNDVLDMASANGLRVNV